MHKQNKYTLASTSKSSPYLEYINQFKEINNHPNSLAQFSDGLILLQLAQLIKDFTINGDFIDSPKTFSHKLSNLKVLFKSIEGFWSQILGIEIEGEEIDLVQIGRTSNIQQIEKLLELFVKTAVQGQNKDYFIEKVLQTSQETQQFMKMKIEKVFNSDRQSPRKEKEKRMYDKILELDHQNDKLHTVLQEICDEKLELEQKFKAVSDKLSEKMKELQQYESLLHEDVYTPRKKRIMGIPDTSDRKESLIESLKSQIAEMSITHERQIQTIYTEMEKISVKNYQYEKMKNELVLSREIIESHKEFRVEVQQMEHELSQIRAEQMSKQNHIAYMKEKLEKSNRIIVELETSLTTYKGDLQRKNIQINELIVKLEDIERRISPRKGQYSGNNLFVDFPGIVNTEAQAYMETNKSLREELERTRKKLEETQQELDRTSTEVQSLRGCETENRKLREMVMDYSTYRGEQNEILVSSLYHLRKLIQTRMC